MKYVLTYELAEGAQALAMEHFPAHRARIDEFHERGALLLVGTFADEPVGAMGVFTTRDAVDDFMAGDPLPPQRCRRAPPGAGVGRDPAAHTGRREASGDLTRVSSAAPSMVRTRVFAEPHRGKALPA